jgi:hypothetical protein
MKKHDGLLTNILEDKTYLTYWSIFYYNTFGCDVVSWYLYWANCFLLLQSPYLSYPANPPAYYPQSGNLPPGNVSVSFLNLFFFLSFCWWNAIFSVAGSVRVRLIVSGSVPTVEKELWLILQVPKMLSFGSCSQKFSSLTTFIGRVARGFTVQ